MGFGVMMDDGMEDTTFLKVFFGLHATWIIRIDMTINDDIA